MAAMQFLHRTSIRAWADVDVFITPSECVRQKYMSAGFPSRRIVVKPLFAKANRSVSDNNRRYALFVGRLSPEKGVRTLLAAWKQLSHIPLVIVGEGPEGAELKEAARQIDNVKVVGSVAHAQVIEYLQHARFLVMPAEWYEPGGTILVEALACATPVIASNIGCIPEIIIDGTVGLLFRAGDSRDLACKAAYLWSDTERAGVLGREARLAYEARFTPEKNYEQLLNVYSFALGRPS
jgi:glycosyltransferase involved in cell wall biosynthesis